MKKVIAICIMLLALTGCVSPDKYVEKTAHDELQSEYDALKKELDQTKGKYESLQGRFSDAQKEIKRLNIIKTLEGSFIKYKDASVNIPSGFIPTDYPDYLSFKKGSTSISLGVKEQTDKDITTKELMEALLTRDGFDNITPDSIEYFESSIGPAARVDLYIGKKKEYHSLCVIMSDYLYAIDVSGETEKDCEVIDKILEGISAN